MTGAEEALRAVARLGPYFDLSPAGEPGLRSMAQLPEHLPELVAAAACALGTTEPRVAGSLLHLELVARLWSVSLGVAAATGRVPDLRPELLGARPGPPGLLALALFGEAGWRDGRDLVGTLRTAVLAEHLVPLHAALRATVRLPQRLLWGNAASALMGTATVLAGHPELRRPGQILTRQLLSVPPLAEAWTAADGAFVRRSCCLYYRLAGAGLCGDCPLRRRPEV